MSRRKQEFKITVHLPDNPEGFKQVYTDFLYGIALKTMKKLPPEQQEAYAEKYIKVFCP
ncbi:MAG: hypothetical protein FWE74_08710 [Oscillospiraceae bacterium]|nr:hypothetical protein [Oscillospiraceae bacterium]